MRVVVEHKDTGCHYLLLGSGLGATESALPSAYWGSMPPQVRRQDRYELAVCSRDGEVHWIQSSELRVVTVDGIAVKDIPDIAPHPQSGSISDR